MTRTQQNWEKITAFCVGGKTTVEIAEHVGMQPSSINNYLADMQRAGLIEKVAPKEKRVFGRGGQTCLFVTAGSEPTRTIAQAVSPDVPEEPVWNWDFINVMHKILHLEAR